MTALHFSKALGKYIYILLILILQLAFTDEHASGFLHTQFTI